MPDYRVIAAVTNTLQQLMQSGLSVLSVPGTQPPKVQVHDLRTQPTSDVVTLFLYEVVEDPSARNRPRIREPIGDRTRIRKPNLALLLRYLVTPWMDSMQDPLADQIALGRLSQVLYENAIVSRPDLVGPTLLDSAEALKVTMAPISLEDRTRIWTCLHLPYRLSLTYEVRVINIETEKARDVAIVSRGDFKYGDVVGVNE